MFRIQNQHKWQECNHRLINITRCQIKSKESDVGAIVLAGYKRQDFDYAMD